MASIQSGAGGKSRYQGDDAAAAAAAQSTDSLPGEGDDSRTGHSDQMQSTPQMHSKRGAAGSRKPSDSPPRAHATAGAPRRGASGNERLYEAYNELHALAQVFEKPFDAPAVLVVGHQTDGKSALIEALMGFQFNSVGGGTKTRRPIALHMTYNPACQEPACYLVGEDMQERAMSLEQLQAHIEAENCKLADVQQFSAKEIVVRVEYRYCPNLTIIDTPGLISAAPGKGNTTLQAFSHQVEAIVRSKMEQREFIILCLEDTNDWTNATTRRLVMQVDPLLQRSVLVATKFDAKLPQFSRGADVGMFLHPTNSLGLGDAAAGQLGGAPFFTSVPSGRVGPTADDVFRSNTDFRAAVAEREARDLAEAEAKMARKLDKAERSHMGISQLRCFLEQLLQRRYLDSVPAIVPLLEKESRKVQGQLTTLQQELEGLAPDKLREKGRIMVETFLSKLQLLLRGTASASPDKFGETLADEQQRGGSFLSAATSRAGSRTGSSGGAGPVQGQGQGREGGGGATALPNAHMRLFGGAQYHRAMAEFRLAVGQVQCPEITREEIANACGIDDLHDGINHLRTACLLAVTRASDVFEPLLHQLGCRLAHVLSRLLPISLHLMQRDDVLPAGHDMYLRRISTVFTNFVEEVQSGCEARCMEDLHSTTRYVSWSLHTRGAAGLRSLVTAKSTPLVPSAAPPPPNAAPVGGKESSKDNGKDSGNRSQGGAHGSPGNSGGQIEAAGTAGVGNNLVLLELLDGTLNNRQLSGSSEELVAALAARVFEGIRDFVIQSAELKFNCFFLMPLVDAFPLRLRGEAERAMEEAEVGDAYDLAAARAALEARRGALTAEVHQLEQLRRKFSGIHATLVQQQPSAAAVLGGAMHAFPAAVHHGAEGAAMGGLSSLDDRLGLAARSGAGGGMGRRLPLDAHMVSISESVANSTIGAAIAAAAASGATATAVVTASPGAHSGPTATATSIISGKLPAPKLSGPTSLTGAAGGGVGSGNSGGGDDSRSAAAGATGSLKASAAALTGGGGGGGGPNIASALMASNLKPIAAGRALFGK